MLITSTRTRARNSRMTTVLVVLLLLCAVSFGAIAQVAWASHHYHVTCVPHGFVHGDSTSDGSFFSRVEYGCSSEARRCAIYNYGNFIARVIVGGTSTCNAWSRNYGTYRECASSAHVEYYGVFSEHGHLAANWCG